VSPGLEPVFVAEMKRTVLIDDDGSQSEYTVRDYGHELYRAVYGVNDMPPKYLQTLKHIDPPAHLRIMEACQQHIDASISKTINVPEDIPYEAFQLVYDFAYEKGCKGCTTYRPSEIRGSIIRDSSAPAVVKEDAPVIKLMPRPDILQGWTYKVKWPSIDESYYITINEANGQPFEMFITSTSAKYSDWTTALSLMLSAIMRRGDDIGFVPEELKKVVSAVDSGYIGGKWYGSLVALIGKTIGDHMERRANEDFTSPHSGNVVEAPKYVYTVGESSKTTTPSDSMDDIIFDICPKCNQRTLHHDSGCATCTNCFYSKC
jgi:ribonucleoside-diphosphate reductase alpha chain